MSAGEIHKSDIGVIFEFTVKDQDGLIVDVSGASTKTMVFDKPDGTNVEKAASFSTDGTDGIIKYTTVLGDLDQIGEWRLQAFIVIPTGEFHSDITEFRVYPNL